LYKPDENSSPEKYLLDPEESPHLRNQSWILNDFSRRLKMSPIVPKVNLSEAGKLSSTYFTELLIEDNTFIEGGFQGFLDRLTLHLRDKITTSR
jgi:hypothetical protein